jgi:hypothetical protein
MNLKNPMNKVTHAMNLFRMMLTTNGWRWLALSTLLALPLTPALAAQQTFATPEAAVDALASALKANDEAELLALFGDQHKSLVISGDRAQDAAVRAKAAEDLGAFRALNERGADRRVLLMGAQAWPLPIPLVRQAGAWRFATEEGADEMVNRRIGANEHSAIHVLQAYIKAQRDYASTDHDGDGVLQYAQKLASTAGKQDSLYWPTDAAKGEAESPFGPLIAESSRSTPGRKAGDPFQGYHFRILTRQGKSAPGGAYSYIINGRMIAGFAMLAYPAAYGDSGVMSFMVSHNGKIYEKNLGKNGTAIGAKVSSFDPDASWKASAP